MRTIVEYEFEGWVQRNKHSNSSAARELGISRQTVVNLRNTPTTPLWVELMIEGWNARHAKETKNNWQEIDQRMAKIINETVKEYKEIRSLVQVAKENDSEDDD